MRPCDKHANREWRFKTTYFTLMTINRFIPRKHFYLTALRYNTHTTRCWSNYQDNVEVKKGNSEVELQLTNKTNRRYSHDCINKKMPPTEQNEPDIWDPASAKKDTVIESGDVSRKPGDEEPIWVFGYGSLIWKTNFPYTRKLSGFIKGFARRFWQGSTDHRGVPGNPGRVVTLIPREKDLTWGVAYEVLPASVPEVMAYLNHREKGGYTLHSVEFYPKDGNLMTFPVYVYIATETNKEFLGDAPLEDIAKQVARSRGPSGENSEYLLRLAKAVREMGVQDDHLFELEIRVSDELMTNRLKISTKASGFDERYPSNKSIILSDRDSDRQD